MLYNKWWKPPNDMCVPEESGAGAKTNTLDFKNICKLITYSYFTAYIATAYLTNYLMYVRVYLFRWRIRCASSGTHNIDYGIYV